MTKEYYIMTLIHGTDGTDRWCLYGMPYTNLELAQRDFERTKRCCPQRKFRLCSRTIGEWEILNEY
jgi:hypothetical protein